MYDILYCNTQFWKAFFVAAEDGIDTACMLHF